MALVHVDVSEDQGASVAEVRNIRKILRADLMEEPYLYATCSRMYASSTTAIHNILHLIN